MVRLRPLVAPAETPRALEPGPEVMVGMPPCEAAEAGMVLPAAIPPVQEELAVREEMQRPRRVLLALRAASQGVPVVELAMEATVATVSLPDLAGHQVAASACRMATQGRTEISVPARSHHEPLTSGKCALVSVPIKSSP